MKYEDLMENAKKMLGTSNNLEDKILLNNIITTTKQNPSEFYFNYLIMGYNIV